MVNLHTSGQRPSQGAWDAWFGGPRRWESLGSGFVVDAERCLVVTNQHVIARATEIQALAYDGRKLRAELLGSSEQIDLAVLRLPDCDLPAVELGDTSSLRVGADVFAVGNPYGHGHTVTRGILSARARSLGRDAFDLFLQTDAAINPGNSGGPLFDAEGRVIGVNTAIDGRGEAIGFAMPVELVKGALEKLAAGEPVEAGWPGLHLQEENSGGLRVLKAYEGGPSAKAGVRAGDLIVGVGDQPLRGRADWAEAFEVAFPGDARVLQIRRGEQALSFELLLEPRRAWVERLAGPPVSIEALAIVVQQVPPDFGDRFGADHGVAVIEARRGAPFALGDVLLELGGQRIERTKDVVAAARLIARDRVVDALVLRKGRLLRMRSRW